MNFVYVYSSPGEKYVLARGNVGPWFRRHGIPAYRCARDNGWWVRRERADHVLALMEIEGLRPQWIDGTAPPYVPPAPVIVEDVA